MGCVVSKNPSTVAKIVPGGGEEKLFETSRIPLDAKETQLVRKTWAILGDRQVEVGKSLFLRFFEEHPTSKDLFPEFRNISNEKIAESPALYGHARRVMKSVDNAVASIENVQVYSAYLYELGTRHQTRQLSEEQLKFMGGAFLFAMRLHLRKEWSRATSKAWEKIFSFMADAMMRGCKG
ncbi:predicted protein [Nematostella vectensis]|uniref:Globin domain-containing protein n=1 Tax=Nematostella vectensis TaxID=45351 RepID=A7RZB2_NEMVE|nr:neuroglobin [Nematostella vectensis]EDO43247.1 predicted protein [Nematostella vectensis]|eukprot:XP_001635310.1 predicted protein [Nematostella vectensis]